MRTSIPRLKSIRPKSGGAEIRVFRNTGVIDRQDADKMWRETLASHQETGNPDIAGMAVVVWSADNTSTSTLWVKTSSRIPVTMAPRFVAGILRRRLG